uniref:Uncharacterized protein LOC100176831 n=1 Tax=Phallusia mammillata TaxID=59560 RepID=A0A6F9DGS7_9ASCI|nr:uncharacterized protein LOC100176831 [Phallusia mammillata]
MLVRVSNLRCILSIALILCNRSATGDESQEQWLQTLNKLEIRNRFSVVHYEKAEERIYAGGVNWIYKIDARNVSNVIMQTEWSPDNNSYSMCMTFQRDENLCTNTIKILVSVNSTHLYVCGTLAYNPSCGYMKKDIMEFLDWTIRHRSFRAPHNPFTSTVAVAANETLFTATSKARMGMEGMISKALNGFNLRTIDENKYWLNEPQFVNMYHSQYKDSREDKVMVLFREKAEEFRPFDYGLASDPDHRNQVSRVATMCLSDHGGTRWVLHMRFTTFRKMTITCTTVNEGGANPFRYDNLESTYMMENAEDRTNPTMYALFTSAKDGGDASAMCVYKMKDIRKSLDSQVYWKNRHDAGSEITSSYGDDGPEAPGKCVGDTRELPQSRLLFGMKHPTKFGNIYPSSGKPLFQAKGERFRHVVVHQMSSSDSSLPYDVTILYLSNEACELKRVVVNTVTSESWNLPTIKPVPESDEKMLIQKLVIRDRDVIVTSNRTMIQVPFASCSLYAGCNECVNAKDPYCTWTRAGVCKSVFELNSIVERQEGLDAECPEPVDHQQIRTDIISELQANLTAAQKRDEELQAQIDALNDKQEQHIMELQGCRKMSEAFDYSMGNITIQLNNRVKALDACKRKQNSLLDQLSLCKTRAQSATAKAAAAWKKLTADSRGGEIAKVIKRLRMTNYDTQLELLTCSESLRNCTEGLASKTEKYTLAKAKMESMGRACRVQKNMATIALRSQVTALRNVSDHMRKNLVATKSKCNVSTTSANCNNKVKSVMRDVTRLVAINRNMTRDVESLQQQHDNNLQLIRQLTWLHRKNGLRGQQKCEYDGWFMSNTTGNMFKLGKTRLGFLQARTYCRQNGGSLAVFKDHSELRYINNVIRAFSQRQPFWIGLVKHKNGTLKWQDGSILDPSDLERFPRSQEGRLTRNVIYCVELTAAQRWSLVPCQRTRRPICERQAVTGEKSGKNSENYFQVLVKSR